MKHYKRLLIGSVVLCVALVLLAGCGVPQSEYEALQSENASLAAEKTSLEAELGQANSDSAKAEADYDALKADYDAMKADHDTLSADYEAASNELAEMKEVYPPRDFSSLSELRDWLMANDISEKPDTQYAGGWYGRALEVQEAAARDGYLVSVDYDYCEEDDTYDVWCATVIDGYIWLWDPETDEAFQDEAFGVVE